MDSTGTIARGATAAPATSGHPPVSPTSGQASEALAKELRDSALLLGLVLLVLGAVVGLSSAALLL